MCILNSLTVKHAEPKQVLVLAIPVGERLGNANGLTSQHGFKNQPEKKQQQNLPALLSTNFNFEPELPPMSFHETKVGKEAGARPSAAADSFSDLQQLPLPSAHHHLYSVKREQGALLTACRSVNYGGKSARVPCPR